MRKQGYEGRYGKRYTERKNRRKKVRIQRITLLGTAVLTACLIAVGGTRIRAAMEERRILHEREYRKQNGTVSDRPDSRSDQSDRIG